MFRIIRQRSVVSIHWVVRKTKCACADAAKIRRLPGLEQMTHRFSFDPYWHSSQMWTRVWGFTNELQIQHNPSPVNRKTKWKAKNVESVSESFATKHAVLDLIFDLQAGIYSLPRSPSYTYTFHRVFQPQHLAAFGTWPDPDDVLPWFAHVNCVLCRNGTCTSRLLHGRQTDRQTIYQD